MWPSFSSGAATAGALAGLADSDEELGAATGPEPGASVGGRRRADGELHLAAPPAPAAIASLPILRCSSRDLALFLELGHEVLAHPDRELLGVVDRLGQREEVGEVVPHLARPLVALVYLLGEPPS